MSTIASRPFKVPPVRASQTDANEKSALAAATSGYLARAVTLHLAGKREEALKQLERRRRFRRSLSRDVPRHGAHPI